MPQPASRRKPAPRNRTISLTDAELVSLRQNLLKVTSPVLPEEIINKTICGSVFSVLDHLPSQFIDLVFADPPYNLNKTFNSSSFKASDPRAYEQWLDSWMNKLPRLLRPNASVYLCGDWRSSSAIFNVARRYFTIRNRITWEREKGRGAQRNWKNCSEDIWFCTPSNDYYFNVDAVKLRRKVIAPYRDATRQPKGWQETDRGRHRLTHPSNIWTDITVPFWSMPENTSHPTQKPEKLLAKIILASSPPDGLVFDPFLGSGTTSVVAKKLGRRYLGIEMDEYYSCLAEKRLQLAERDKAIQGYAQGVFWERNALNLQTESPRAEKHWPTRGLHSFSKLS